VKKGCRREVTKGTQSEEMGSEEMKNRTTNFTQGEMETRERAAKEAMYRESPSRSQPRESRLKRWCRKWV